MCLLRTHFRTANEKEKQTLLNRVNVSHTNGTRSKKGCEPMPFYGGARVMTILAALFFITSFLGLCKAEVNKAIRETLTAYRNYSNGIPRQDRDRERERESAHV